MENEDAPAELAPDEVKIVDRCKGDGLPLLEAFGVCSWPMISLLITRKILEVRGGTHLCTVQEAPCSE